MGVEPSYVHGGSGVPLVGRTLGEALEEAAQLWGERTALVVPHQDVRWSYRELAARVDALACGFMAAGLEAGARIGIWSPNNAEWVLTQFASAKAGLVLVNINPAYRVAELEHALQQSGCAALIVSERFKTSDYVAMIRELAPELDGCLAGSLRAARLPALRLVAQIGARAGEGACGISAFEALCAGPVDHDALAARAACIQFDDPVNIQFTSGTTGMPKGATLTHHSILNNGRACGEGMALTCADRLCIPVPFYHCFGMVMGNLACVTHGAAMVVPGASFDALAVLKTIEQERCTAVHGVPTMFIAMLACPERADIDLSSLRTGIMAGAPCPIDVMRRVIDEMGVREITIAYGMTETSPVSFQTDRNDPIERRVATVGRVHPHVEVKIIDAAGRIVPRGTPGELCTRGYCVMRGYWGAPDLTAQAIDAAGWMHTGDLATLDADGYCNIVGRINDMVIRGGENIYPREVEDFMRAHPAIEDVQVFGVPDLRYGEEVCAWVRLRPGQSVTGEDLRAWCAGRITHFKVPRYIEIVDVFPMTVTGKIQKFAMRHAMAERLGVAEQKTA